MLPYGKQNRLSCREHIILKQKDTTLLQQDEISLISTFVKRQYPSSLILHIVCGYHHQ